MAAEMSGKQKRRQTRQLHPTWEDTSLWKNPRKGVLSTEQAPCPEQSLLCSDTSHHTSDPENLREEATMADLTEDLGWEF